VRSRTTPDLRGRCPKCYLREGYCLCGLLSPLPTRTELVIVRHAHEGWKSTNTARIACLALPKARMVEYPPEGPPPLDWLSAQAWLLFPEDGAGAPLAPPPTQLVILDGTWRQARKMLRRMPALGALPRLSLPPRSAAAARLRRSPHAAVRSTLEAIADALNGLEGEPVSQALHALHDEYVARVLHARGWRLPPKP
jgi:DTW domain-containing protein